MKRILALVFTLAVVFFCVTCIVMAITDSDATAGAPTSFELKPGASVRDAAKSGLRFETRILTSEYNALKKQGDVVIGTLIIPTDLVSGPITVESDDVMNLTSETAGVITDGDYTVFYATVVDIEAQNYARRFSARSYIKVGDTYYYTAYSDASNARSIYEAAVEAWESGTRNDTVRGYLDKVVVINGSMLLSKAIKDYTSPYTVSYANDTITVTATDGTLFEGDIATMIVDYNGRIFSGDWSIANNTLTAPYKAGLMMRDDLTDEADRDPKGSGWYGTNFGIRFNGTIPKGTTVAVKDGVVTFMKAENQQDKSWGQLRMNGNVPEELNTGDFDTLTISMSIKTPDNGIYGMQKIDWKLLGALEITSSWDGNYRIGPTSLGNDPGDYIPVTAVSSEAWTDITLRIDLVDNKLYTYVNGALKTATDLTPPSGATLLEWAKEMTSSYVLVGDTKTLDADARQAICIDSVSWGLSKTHNNES